MTCNKINIGTIGKFKKAGISGSVWNVILVKPRLIINIRLASKSIVSIIDRVTDNYL